MSDYLKDKYNNNVSKAFRGFSTYLEWKEIADEVDFEVRNLIDRAKERYGSDEVYDVITSYDTEEIKSALKGMIFEEELPYSDGVETVSLAEAKRQILNSDLFDF